MEALLKAEREGGLSMKLKNAVMREIHLVLTKVQRNATLWKFCMDFAIKRKKTHFLKPLITPICHNSK